jgi:hypothetical protein
MLYSQWWWPFRFLHRVGWRFYRSYLSVQLEKIPAPRKMETAHFSETSKIILHGVSTQKNHNLGSTRRENAKIL